MNYITLFTNTSKVELTVGSVDQVKPGCFEVEIDDDDQTIYTNIIDRSDTIELFYEGVVYFPDTVYPIFIIL